jgi:HlyD family secretion protein
VGGIPISPIARRVASRSLWVPLLAASLSGCGAATGVEVTSPYRGEIQESFTEPARTRLANTYPITMPVNGRIARIELEPGDPVKAGETLMEFDTLPLERAVAEARAVVAELEASIAVQDDERVEQTALSEARATAEAAAEALKVAEAQVRAGKARLDRAIKELRRVEQLTIEQAVAQSVLDDARVKVETLQSELRQYESLRDEAKARLAAAQLGPISIERQLERKRLEREVLVHQLEQARARLARAEHDLRLADIRSPIDGVVLERYEQGDSTLLAGQPLLLLGNLAELEVIADVLTQDALRVARGSEVILEPAARHETVGGTVNRIEPAGFTKFSSLGVEQQRVNVIVSFNDPHEDLGVGYRLQARFITGSKSDALIVPRFSVLQAPDRSFYVFKVVDARLVRQPITIGLRGDLDMEVTTGLSENDLIVAVPDTTMKEGMAVEMRETTVHSNPPPD